MTIELVRMEDQQAATGPHTLSSAADLGYQEPGLGLVFT